MAVTPMSQAKVRATAFSTSGRITDFAQLGTVHLSNLSLMSGEAKVLMVSWFGLTVSEFACPRQARTATTAVGGNVQGDEANRDEWSHKGMYVLDDNKEVLNSPGVPT